MIRWPNEVVEAIARRRCVLMIGSGVSRNSDNNAGRRPATWEQFLRAQVDVGEEHALISELIDRKDYLSACDIIKTSMGYRKFARAVQSEYLDPGYAPADIHKHLYNLDVSVVASPNFDAIYENYASSTSNGTCIVKTHTSRDIAGLIHGGNRRLIIKTHGSAAVPDEIIFTRRDYAAARTKHSLFYEIMKSLALTHTFLFIGCGIDDPDVRLIFEDLQFSHDAMLPHYMTIPSGENHSRLLEMCMRDMSIEFLEYSPEENHIELTASLEALVRDVDDYRADILCKNQNW